jgi:hypothetical protein
MEKVRAEILETNSPYLSSARIEISAPAQHIFDLIADPRCHQLFDGSGTLQGSISGPTRLHLGAKFGMAMKIRIPYRITNARDIPAYARTWLNFTGAMSHNPKWIAKSLVRLKTICESK